MTCKRCVSPCLTCTSSNLCLSCIYNFLYGQNCISECPLGYYANITLKTCEPCFSGCEECSSRSICTKCEVGSCLNNGECITECEYGLYYSSLDQNNYCSCIECNYPCKLCISSNECLSCTEGYLF